MIDEKRLIRDLNLLVSRSFLGEVTACSRISVREIYSLSNDQPKTGEWIQVSNRLPMEEEYKKNDGRFIACDGNRVYQVMFDIYHGKFCFPRYVNSLCYELEEDKYRLRKMSYTFKG